MSYLLLLKIAHDHYKTFNKERQILHMHHLYALHIALIKEHFMTKPSTTNRFVNK